MKGKKILILVSLLFIICVSCFSNVFAANYGGYVDEYGIEYDYGYEDGYEMGYEEGHNEGWHEGYDEGYDEGYGYGYDKGCDDGYKKRIEDAAAENEKQINQLLIFITVIAAIALLKKFIKNHRKD